MMIDGGRRTKVKFRVEVYRDRAREWRYRIRAANGKIVAGGAEGYLRKKGVLQTVYRLQRYLGDSPVVYL